VGDVERGQGARDVEREEEKGNGIVNSKFNQLIVKRQLRIESVNF
jgi:hypothetical protein